MTTLDVVIPVLNEEKDLPQSIATLHWFLCDEMGEYDWRIVIADNGSTDATPQVCEQLCKQSDRVDCVRLEERGRGRALVRTWSQTKADVVGYMDVDLSTDLSALPKLVSAIEDDGYDIAVGSRLTKGADVIGRGLKREVASKSYSLIFRAMFFTKFKDAQCGFKALSRKAADEILPFVQDTSWFFDTEMLILAEKNGYRVKEVAVKWTEDPDSRVNIIGTAYGDMKGLLRLRFGGLRKASRLLAERRDGRQT